MGFDDLIGTAGGSIGGGKSAKKAPTSPRKSSDGTGKKPTAQKGRKKPRSKEAQEMAALRRVVERGKHYDVEAVSGDIVETSGGVAASAMPSCVEDVARMAPAWVGEWCELHAVPDMRKASPLVYGAMCQDIGRRYIKPSRILRDKQPHGVTPTGGAATCGAYDPSAVMALYDIFRRVCGECDKIPFQRDFADFAGISLQYLREYREWLTSAGVHLAQKTREEELQAIRRKSASDPVGRLAILNNEHWGGNHAAPDVPSVAVQALPRFDGSGGAVDGF